MENFYLKQFTIDAARYAIHWPEINEILEMMNNQMDFNPKMIQGKLLKSQLRKAYKKIPFYKQFSQLKDLQIENAFEILQTLPIVDKDYIKSNYSLFSMPGKDVDNNKHRQTSGTSGNPLVFLASKNKEAQHQIAFYEYITGQSFLKQGLTHVNTIAIDGSRISENDISRNVFWIKNSGSDLYGRISFSSVHMNDQTLPFYVKKITELNPYLLRGYPSAILKLGRFIKDHNSLADISWRPKGIYLTSENSNREDMNELSEIFSCPVFGQYGHTEASVFGWTQPNRDIYYCSPFYGFTEVLDDRNNQVNEGQIGEIVVTGFGNDVQPFIRYRTGDIAEYGGKINGIVKLNKILGRNNDFIINNAGQTIPLCGLLDIHYLDCQAMIKGIQVQQFEKGKVLIFLSVSLGWNKAGEDEIRNLLSLQDIDCSFRYVTEIPLSSNGKQRLMIQELKKFTKF